jgi:hypothetical protein
LSNNLVACNNLCFSFFSILLRQEETTKHILGYAVVYQLGIFLQYRVSFFVQYRIAVFAKHRTLFGYLDESVFADRGALYAATRGYTLFSRKGFRIYDGQGFKIRLDAHEQLVHLTERLPGLVIFAYFSARRSGKKITNFDSFVGCNLPLAPVVFQF